MKEFNRQHPCMFYFRCNNVSPFKDINHSFAYIVTTQFPPCLSFSGRKMDLRRGYTPHTEVHYAVDLNTIIPAAYPQARGVCAPATRHLPRDSSLKFHQIFHWFRSRLLLVNSMFGGFFFLFLLQFFLSFISSWFILHIQGCNLYML